jgi:hypothetical protein
MVVTATSTYVSYCTKNGEIFPPSYEEAQLKRDARQVKGNGRLSVGFMVPFTVVQRERWLYNLCTTNI